LRTCQECRAALEEMNVIKSALASRPIVSTPADGDWAPFMARLGNALEAEGAGQRSESSAVFSRRSTGQFLAMAALLPLVTASVGYLGYQRYARRPVAPLTAPPSLTSNVSQIGASHTTASPAAEPVAASDRALTAMSEQHFERSKLVVLG